MLIIFFLLSLININIYTPKKINHNSNVYLRIKENNIFYNSFNLSNINEKKNLILGIIVKYSWEQILPFFNSFIQANFSNCDVVMFIKDIHKRIRKYLRSIGVILIHIPKEYNDMDIPKLRWKLYKDFLKSKEIEYNLVFTTDIRDVIFQKDIFQVYKNNKSFIGFAFEDETLNEKTNKMWITSFAGEKKHKAIQNKTIICFGTIWGTIDKLIEFSKILWKNIKYDKNSTDQGIGNYLIYYEKIFNDCLIISDNYGPIISIGWNKRENITLDSNYNILNFRGEIASVVHQYDRHLDILKEIQEKFLYKFYIKESNTTKNVKTEQYYKNIINFLIFLQFSSIIFLLKKININL